MQRTLEDKITHATLQVLFAIDEARDKAKADLASNLETRDATKEEQRKLGLPPDEDKPGKRFSELAVHLTIALSKIESARALITFLADQSAKCIKALRAGTEFKAQFTLPEKSAGGDDASNGDDEQGELGFAKGGSPVGEANPPKPGASNKAAVPSEPADTAPLLNDIVGPRAADKLRDAGLMTLADVSRFIDEGGKLANVGLNATAIRELADALKAKPAKPEAGGKPDPKGKTVKPPKR